MIDAISEAFVAVLHWIKTTWNLLPEEIKPGIAIGAVIATALALIKVIVHRR